MIKCKVAMDIDTCGKTICCVECEDKESCGCVCGYIEELDPKECEEAILEGNELVAFGEKAAAVIQSIADIAKQKKELEELDKEMRRQLEKAMDAFEIKSFENDLIKITYVEPTVRTSVDSAKLKKKYPEIFNECSKNSEVKGSVRITVK